MCTLLSRSRVVGPLLAVSILAAGFFLSRSVSPAADDGDSDAAVQKELAKLQGTWQELSCEGLDEKTDSEDYVRTIRLLIKGDRLSYSSWGDGKDVRFVIDPAKKTLEHPWLDGTGMWRALYSLEGDKLRWCEARKGEAAPTEFSTTRGGGHALRLFQLVPAAPSKVIPPAPSGRVPEVVGLTAMEAKARLAEAGFTQVTFVVSSTAPPSRALELTVQKQSALASVTDPIPAVTLVVYPKFEQSLPPLGRVPGVVGLTAKEAKTRLANAGFTQVTIAASGTAPPGKEKELTVEKQAPAEGSMAKPEDAIALHLYPKFEATSSKPPDLPPEPSSKPRGRVALSAPASVGAGQVFTARARVTDPLPGQTLTLVLPPGLDLADGLELRQPVPASQIADGPVSVAWKVKAGQPGAQVVKVQSSPGDTSAATIQVEQATVAAPTALDALTALKMSVKLLPVDMNYDVDSDGQVTSRDAVIIAQRRLDELGK